MQTPSHRLKVAQGESSFRNIRLKEAYYIDKTRLVSEITASANSVLLLTRPRRFGKTLNMTMLEAFFDQNQDSRELFEGLEVCNDPKAMAQLNAYPTVFLTFKNVGGLTWDTCYSKLRECLASLVANSSSHLRADLVLGPTWRRLKAVEAGTADEAQLEATLGSLIEALHASTGKQVVVLIDEYDNPIHKGLAQGYGEKIIAFMRGFLSTLKDNPHHKYAVITGILRVAKESIYSGLNNLSVYTVLSTPFSSHFGFTTDEVRKVLKDFELAHLTENVRDHYNGYRFGNNTMTNPWSLLAFVQDPAAGLLDHWLGTADNSLIKNLILNHESVTAEELAALLAGQPLQRPISTPVELTNLRAGNVWNLLVHSGYLTATEYDGRQAKVSIPNREVRTFFETTVRDWLSPRSDVHLLLDSLLNQKFNKFGEQLQEILCRTFSYHDLKGLKEQFYHVFFVTLMVAIDNRYQVVSNREHGFGRSDLALIPTQAVIPGFIFEFKACGPKELQAEASKALAQVDVQNYIAPLRDKKIERIFKVGIAFSGKRIALEAQQEDATQEPFRYLGEAEPEPEPKPESDRKASVARKLNALRGANGEPPLTEAEIDRLTLAELEAQAQELFNRI